MAIVVIVQHAEKERLPGDPGLTTSGYQQALATASWMGEHLNVSAVFSSPLKRALETAKPIGAATGLDVQVDDRLLERMNWEDPASLTLDMFMREWDLTGQDRDFVPSFGDSSRVAAERFEAFLDDLNLEDAVVVAVSHGGVTVDLLRTLMGDVELEAASPRIIATGVPSSALTYLHLNANRWNPQVIAWTGHLRSPPHDPPA